MPPIDSSTVRSGAAGRGLVTGVPVAMTVLLTRVAERADGRGSGLALGQLVAGFLDGLAYSRPIERVVADDAYSRGRTGDEVDGHLAYAGQLGDLFTHGRDAMVTGHAVYAVRRGDAHLFGLQGSASRVGGMIVAVPHQLRTSRAMASDASRTFRSASVPPCCTAWVTQCARCSSSSSKENDWSAFVAAETCVRTSMQYLSSSTIRCRPLIWPSIRRSRLR